MEENVKLLLEKSLIGRLAVCAENVPYVIPMNYGFDNSYIYCHCRGKGKKLDIISQNPNVCFEVDECEKIITTELACNWTVIGSSVIITGTAEIVESDEEKKKAMDRIMAHHAPDQTFHYVPVYFNAVKVIKIKIEEATFKEKAGN